VAMELVRWLLPDRVLVRVGIAHGSFEAVRFRSDVTADSGDHAAHFLGTGVVRSHEAEKCGIKGIRILLHSSVVPLLHDASYMRPPVEALPTFMGDIPGETASLADQDQIRFPLCLGNALSLFLNLSSSDHLIIFVRTLMVLIISA
jgi:hypothetical protein